MRILYASSEVSPFAKTGGLADVAGALPPALTRLGHDVKVIMPGYTILKEGKWRFNPLGNLQVKLGGKTYSFLLEASQLPDTGVTILLLSQDHLFGRQGLYQENGKDYPDNMERFSAFSRAILEVPRILNWHPDVIHCNEWQTALAIVYMDTHLKDHPDYKKTGTLFTIHNLGYQGLFPASEFPSLDLPPEYFHPGALEFYDKINLLKAGLVFGGILNTVSPTYSREIQTTEFGCGLEGVLHARRNDLFGIINGVDYKVWDPGHDPYIPKQYDFKHPDGKGICKKGLQKECGLPETEAPIIGMITRLTAQKGVDLIIKILDELMRLDLQLVILGDGDPAIHRALQEAMSRHPKRLSVHLAFNEGLAHRIEAGSDLFLMPSRYEPCGLNQLYSIRYGTVPVARKTGGLADTIIDATPSNIEAGRANGFIFEHPGPHELLTTVRLSLKLFQEKEPWKQLMHAGMMADFSWDRSAREYERLYALALEKATSWQRE